MKKITIGILAHVDSGKTTLSEGLLFESGEIRKMGRVDHKNAFLDTNEIERERGITIFSKQAIMRFNDAEITLLDTPGHVDFSSEAERVLSVLDYAVLVISGADGVQSHTETLWRLLERYNVPVFVFVNKMDISPKTAEEITAELKEKLGDGLVDFSSSSASEKISDELSVCSEELMEEVLKNGTVTKKAVANAVAERLVFPCFFGSALKNVGVKELIEGILNYSLNKEYSKSFGARVFKITDDGKGTRLTHLKVTGGVLKVRDEICGKDGNRKEKINQIRFYSGDKFITADEAEAGSVCAVSGLSKTFSGEGLGTEITLSAPVLEPVLSYKLVLPKNVSCHEAIFKLKLLEEEDPQLKIVWNEQAEEIHIQLMGEVQLEVLKRIISERFGIKAEFGKGAISYKETIKEKMLGIGHFEPLRHYAEVHLLIEPQKRGSGIKFESACSGDVLDRNWQRLILTHLREKTHVGVLTGSPITDVKITIINGRAHKKHTEGGDFRQATYRAVRQGLMRAESVLLEPWYNFKLTVPSENIGRAMNDLSRMSASFSSPETLGETAQISGCAPVSEMREYQTELNAYTGGRGRLFCVIAGYEPCHNAEEVIEEMGYIAESDTENTADSVFCANGAGFTVKWNEVQSYANIEVDFKSKEELEQEAAKNAERARAYIERAASDEELMQIFERTYGEIKRREYKAPKKVSYGNTVNKTKKASSAKSFDKEYLLVDGYNIIYSWDDLKEAAKDNLDAARSKLIDILCNYRGFMQCEVIAVFDAYKVKNNPGTVEKINNISIVYTKEAETADMYIEKVSRKLGEKNRVRVATSDALEQLIILGGGALRVSAEAFKKEVLGVEKAIRELIEN